MAGPLIPNIDDDDAEKTALQHVEKIRKKLREAQKVDLAFLLDATGSMQPSIIALKAKIVEIAEGVKGAFPEAGELRVACAFYRDYDVDDDIDSTTGKPRYERSGICCSFTDNVKVFQERLEGLIAEGGDDEPEDVFSGLERLLDLDWKAPAARFVYHIADAPCHGRRFHDPQYTACGKLAERAFEKERFRQTGATSEGDPEGRKIEDILLRLAGSAKISNYTFLHIHKWNEQRPYTAKMLEEFRKANDSTPGSGMKIDEHIVKVPPQPRGNEAELALAKPLSEVVTNGVKRSVTSSMNDIVNKPNSSVDRYTSTRYEEVRVDDSIPSDWATLPDLQVFCHRSGKYETVDEMLTQMEQGAPLGFRVNKNAPIHVRIANHPFTAACVTRWPFYAKIQMDRTSSEPATWPTFVMKKFKSLDCHVVQESYVNPFKNPYLEVMETYAIASQFALQFYAQIKSKKALDRVKPLYLDSLPATCKVAGSRSDCFTVEKLHSNAQWIKVDEQSEYYETLQSFSHWTHAHSGSFLMVIVHTLIIDGETLDKKPMLCDPTIHSGKFCRRFKRTNKGDLGIQYFYRSHICNEVCKVLGLQETASK